LGPLGLEKVSKQCLEASESCRNVPFLAFLDPRGFGAARVRVEGLSVFGILIYFLEKKDVSWQVWVQNVTFAQVVRTCNWMTRRCLMKEESK